MTSSGSVLIKAGANVSTIISEDGDHGIDADTLITQFINEAESFVNIRTRFNWTGAYGALDAVTKQILDETVSNLAAVYAIEYDPDAIGRSTAIAKINVLWARIDKNLPFLDDIDKVKFIKNP